MQATPDASMISLRSQYSLPRNTNTIPIKRYAQRRNIALVREFGWGVLQLTNPDHCNFSLLHDILFKSYREALETWTNEYFYENYRMSRLASNPDISQWSRAQQMIFQQELEAKHTALPLDPSDASTGGQACTGDQACNVTIASSYPNTAMSGTNMLNANMSPSRDGANGQPQFNFSIPFPPPGRFSPFSYSGKTASQAADFSFTKDRDQRVSDATTLTSRTAHLSVGKDVSDTMSDRRSSSVSSSLRRNRYTVTTSTQPVIF
ncbi:hypothetical protein EC988_000481 [Linderina pennispora]|nr:hypothetical protein EC988_000481 [Linderina pennispora]